MKKSINLLTLFLTVFIFTDVVPRELERGARWPGTQDVLALRDREDGPHRGGSPAAPVAPPTHHFAPVASPTSHMMVDVAVGDDEDDSDKEGEVRPIETQRILMSRSDLEAAYDEVINYMYRIVKDATGKIHHDYKWRFGGRQHERMEQVRSSFLFLPKDIQEKGSTLVEAANELKKEMEAREDGRATVLVPKQTNTAPDFRPINSMSPSGTMLLFQMFRMVGMGGKFSSAHYRAKRRDLSLFKQMWGEVAWKDVERLGAVLNAVIALDMAVIDHLTDAGAKNQENAERLRKFMSGYDSWTIKGWGLR